MTDYDDFAAEYQGDDVDVFDDAAGEQSVLGEPPALDDATWDAMLEAACEAPVADSSDGVDLLAEFAASITSVVDDFGEALDAFFDGDVDADGFEEDPAAAAVDLDGDGIPDEPADEASGAEPAEGFDDLPDA